MYKLIRPLLFTLEPERAHDWTLNTLKFLNRCHLVGLFSREVSAPFEAFGLTFKNPVGLAAGLDKNAEYIDALAALGFGFLEVGTVTPRPQLGNPRPRLFRLPEQEALINRMGFNSKGLAYFINQLKNKKYDGVLGVSITANTDTPISNTLDDYLTCFRGVYPYASYVSVDVSCPNVKGKEALQSGHLFAALLDGLKTEQAELAKQHDKWVPLVVKVSPDLSPQELTEVAELLLQFRVEGVIATNTTRARTGVEGAKRAKEQGGLSGRPLFAKSLAVVKQLRSILGTEIPIIAAGGIMGVADAEQMRAAGAKLVQIYTGLIYRGPGLIREIAEEF